MTMIMATLLTGAMPPMHGGGPTFRSFEDRQPQHTASSSGSSWAPGRGFHDLRGEAGSLVVIDAGDGLSAADQMLARFTQVMASVAASIGQAISVIADGARGSRGVVIGFGASSWK